MSVLSCLGIKADALDIQAVGRNLTISGERTIASEGEGVQAITAVNARLASSPGSSACPGISIRKRWMPN
jgi:hypothetical protein